MGNSDVNIAKALDMKVSDLDEKNEVETKTTIQSVSGTYKTSEADDDYNVVRRNLKVVIEQSNRAIQGILELPSNA